MKPADMERLRQHLAQHATARLCQAVAAALTIAATLRYGLAGLLCGLAAVWLFKQAEPGPSADLDKLTKRGTEDSQ